MLFYRGEKKAINLVNVSCFYSLAIIINNLYICYLFSAS